MSRRGNNEGSIYQQKSDGRWVGALSLGWSAGKRSRKKFYGRTRKEVQGQMVKAQRDLQLHLPVSTERQTVGQFLDGWLRDVVRQTVRPRTYASYTDIIRRHIAPTLGRVPLQKLTAHHVQRLMNEKATEGLSPRTVGYIRAVLRAALEQAVRWNLLATNAAKHVSAPRAVKFEVRPLSSEEARKFLEHVTGHRLEAVYSVGIAMGLRLGEVLGLRWADVDLERGTLRVEQALQTLGRGVAKELGVDAVTFSQPKSERSKRQLFMPPVVVKSLGAHRKRQLEERLFAGAEWVDSGLVFTNTKGASLDPTKVRKDLRALLRKAELPMIRFHDLRHTCASLLLAQRVDFRTIMHVLGHSQISLTMNTYAHVAESLMVDAAERMAQALEPVRSQQAERTK